MTKVLIIDDDPDTIKLIEKFIKANGHQTYSVIDSMIAIKTIESFKPDLIVMDIMMPQINGITLCKLIKANSEMRHIPVIIVSALADDGTKRDVTNAGAEDFMTKPISPKAFTDQMNTLLNK